MQVGIRLLPLSLTREYISDIILMIQGHFQGQKFNLKVKFAKNCVSVNTSRNKSNTSF